MSPRNSGFDDMTTAELFAMEDAGEAEPLSPFVGAPGAPVLARCFSSPPRIATRPERVGACADRPVPSVAVFQDQPTSVGAQMPVVRVQSADSGLTVRTTNFQRHDSRPKPKLFPRRE